MAARLAYRRLQRRLAGPRLMREFARTHPRAFFIQIGASEGDRYDHLHRFVLGGGWHGIMVEPVPHLFARLRETYGALDGITLENAAISDRDGTLPFYHLVDPTPKERERLPDWYDGVGSLSRETVLAHGKAIPDIEARLVTRQVTSMTFETLCRRPDVDRLDLLAIDTEGYDAEILRTIDFAVRRPRLIVYEHFHLSRPDQRKCLDLLTSAGYEVLEEGFDTFCLLPAGGDALDHCWQRLEPAVAGVSVADERR